MNREDVYKILKDRAFSNSKRNLGPLSVEEFSVVAKDCVSKAQCLRTRFIPQLFLLIANRFSKKGIEVKVTTNHNKDYRDDCRDVEKFIDSLIYNFSNSYGYGVYGDYYVLSFKQNDGKDDYVLDIYYNLQNEKESIDFTVTFKDYCERVRDIAFPKTFNSYDLALCLDSFIDLTNGVLSKAAEIRGSLKAKHITKVQTLKSNDAFLEKELEGE